MRRKIKARKPINPDLKYDSTTIEKFINQIMKEGKKSVVQKDNIRHDGRDKDKNQSGKSVDGF